MEDHDLDIFLEVVECPLCGGDGEFLGQLGSVTHLRCRQCGMEFHTEEDDQ